MKLFKLDNDYNVVPEKETIMLIPEFKILWSLNYNKMKGDTKGLERRKGGAEIVFLYFYCDYRSEFAELSDEERKNRALISADLPDNYKISGELDDAIGMYRHLQETRELKLVSAAYKKVDKLQEYLDSDSDVTDENYKAAMDSISKIGPLLKGLKDLEIQLKKQEAGNKGIRGGQESGFLK